MIERNTDLVERFLAELDGVEGDGQNFGVAKGTLPQVLVGTAEQEVLSGQSENGQRFSELGQAGETPLREITFYNEGGMHPKLGGGMHS